MFISFFIKYSRVANYILGFFFCSRRKDINLTILNIQNPKKTIKELVQRILRNNLSEKDVKAESLKLAKSASNESAGFSRFSQL